ncbi:SRPBCC family protein [Pseudotabrizicola algicola]|uniref:SRPBCC family protein n=1 Tax=Pseudotabrizicola algicola TaxID=2709381 RepID=A0A6B3RJH6_9RHOB|nr:SRPBCC family protein [Pseudotabrizicola algicola]NEX45571.1 SRPBCC family protein [Pseudotabrizicola algicola]
MILNPETDLELVRHLRAAPSKVWRCWTEPALLEQWFAPKPVVTRDAKIDLRPGGIFSTTMDIPEMGTQTGDGCILEVVPERRLVWTDLLGPGYRPVGDAFGFTACILLEPEGSGTLYRAIAMHRTPDQRKSHEDMGFHDGWGTAAAQLDDVAAAL